LIRRDIVIPDRDYDIKSTLYSEGTYITEGTMLLKTFLSSEGTFYRIGTKVLRTLLISKGRKKEIREE